MSSEPKAPEPQPVTTDDSAGDAFDRFMARKEAKLQQQGVAAQQDPNQQQQKQAVDQGVCIQLLIFWLPLALMFWGGGLVMIGYGEWLAVDTMGPALVALQVVKEISCRFEEGHVGQLVHVSCPLENIPSDLTIPNWEANVGGHNAVFLRAEVQMFQYVKRCHSCGKHSTCCDYTSEWSTQLQGEDNADSDHQDEQPDYFPDASPSEAYATHIMLGDYAVSEEELRQLSEKQIVKLKDDGLPYSKCVPYPCQTLTPANTRVSKGGEYLYTGDSEDSEQIGDVRVRFYKSTATGGTVIAKLFEDKTFDKWVNPDYDSFTVHLMRDGIRTADDVLEEEAHREDVTVWCLRGFCLPAFWIGNFGLFFLTTFLDDKHFLNRMCKTVNGDPFTLILASFFLACCLELFVAAVIWFIPFPYYGGLIFLGAVLALGFYILVLHTLPKTCQSQPSSEQDGAATANVGEFSKVGGPDGVQQMEMTTGGPVTTFGKQADAAAVAPTGVAITLH